jgi:hypothetical protein
MSADEVLVSLVQDVEKTGAGYSISLCLKGLIVSGVVINSKRFYDLMSKIFDTDMEPLSKDQSDIDKVRASLDRYRELMQQMSEHIEVDNPEYIHLQNAVIYGVGSELPFIAGLWRGKLSAVDGFNLGLGPHKVKDVTDYHSNQH